MSVRIIVGDCLERLGGLPPESISCCVTSPPYWGLRDYGVSGQLGLEPTPEEYVERMVAVFRGVRRVLSDDGTLWLNLGDTYVHAPQKTHTEDEHSGIHAGLGARSARDARQIPPGLKVKDLVGIPWRVAFALQADGWYLRSDIIWAKPNPMPESVTDRPTKSHEHVFLLSKSASYYWDHEAVAEPATGTAGNARSFRGGGGYTGGQTFDNGAMIARDTHGNAPNESGTRNIRDVWTIATRPYAGAHFAVMPPALVEPCILAGCPKDGTVLDPFTGAGTVGLVAQRLDRDFVGIELNPDYAETAARRILDDQPLFADVELIGAPA